MEITPRYNLRKNIKLRRCLKEDIFSCLPDEVIISHILSRLMPREAGACCFLSRRWQRLWKQSVSCRFIFTSYWGEGYKYPVWGVKEESQQFVLWVNKFLNFTQHKPTIDEFAVRFDLDSSYSHDVNNWLNFAFKKGVKRLELDLTPYLFDLEKDHYVFPGIETFSCLPGLGSSHNMNLSTSSCTGLHNLRDICFKHVDVDGEAIEYMLSKCHSLESLSVKSSNTLINLEVCGESVGLKHLKIVDCENAEKIKISVSCLVSLKYFGQRAALSMRNVPSLSEVCIGGDYCRAFLRRGATNLKCVSQLKKLKLDMTCKVVKECVKYPLKFEKFLSLEQLEVKMEIYNGLFLLWPTILIKAAPALKRFSIKLKYEEKQLMSAYSELTKKKCGRGSWRYPDVDFDTIVVGHTPGLSRDGRSKIRSASQERHECLKVVEIRGFVGNKSDLKLARHLLSMPLPTLEKLVLVPDAPIKNDEDEDEPWEFYQKRSRERANLVKKWLPSPIKLVIV